MGRKTGDMGLSTITGFVTSRIDGEKLEADIAHCGSCGYEAFALWQIKKQPHPHVQCLRCGTSFCFLGECVQAEANGGAKGGATL